MTKRIFKIIFTILLTLILAFSTTLSILLASSSNASLLFKHDDEKMISIVSAQTLSFSSSYFLNTKDQNISITQTTDIGSVYYNFNFSDKDNPIIEIKNGDLTSYYDGSVLYKDINGQSPSSYPCTPFDVLEDVFYELSVLLNTTITDIAESDTKVKMHFDSFKLGLKYEIEDDDRTITSIFSLKGKLKEISMSSATNNIRYEINYESADITLPDLSAY